MIRMAQKMETDTANNQGDKTTGKKYGDRTKPPEL